MSLEQKVTQAWYQDRAWIRSLQPLSVIYRWGLERRRNKSLAKSRKLSVPVIVVGNITVGGTGKTPLIIHLGSKLKQMGLSVGVISRGYGAQTNRYPYKVDNQDSAEQVGDEPLLICRRLGIPVVIDPDRLAAAEHLFNTHEKVDVILSDDGMQHFNLPRDIEILVVDGKRELGNELLLPAGPLREPLDRIRDVDFCLVNGLEADIKSDALKYALSGSFSLEPEAWIDLCSDEAKDFDQVDFTESESAKIHAIAGIGNPQRFFDSVANLGISAKNHALDDHQTLSAEDLIRLGASDPETVILMTTKDAVKYQSLIKEQGWQNCWALEVGVRMQEAVESDILQAILALTKTN